MIINEYEKIPKGRLTHSLIKLCVRVHRRCRTKCGSLGMIGGHTICTHTIIAANNILIIYTLKA